MRINQNIGEHRVPHSIFIASPCYSGDVSCLFASSLLKTCKHLTDNKIPYEVYFSVNDSLVSRARNDLVDKFLKSNCTHILMVDSDQGWDHTAPYRMLKEGKEVVTGAVPARKTEETYALTIHTNEDRTPFVQDGLIKCATNGVAFALIQRYVFDKIKCEKPSKHEVYPFFQHRYFDNGDHYGEDTFFVKTWSEYGDVWISPDITFTHGPITANYHEFLCRQPKPEEIKPQDKILELINA